MTFPFIEDFTIVTIENCQPNILEMLIKRQLNGLLESFETFLDQPLTDIDPGLKSNKISFEEIIFEIFTIFFDLLNEL